MNTAIIGGGASGMFAACNINSFHPDHTITVFEKKPQFLSKVKISGGGRCNLTHASASVADLLKSYPRGAKSLKKVFHQFSHQQTMQWFESRGLKLVVQDDGCVFPASQNAMSVVNLLMQQATLNNVRLQPMSEIVALTPADNRFELQLKDKEKPLLFDRVIVTTGGIPSLSGFEWLRATGHEIIPPAPSLFTFKLDGNTLTSLSGNVINPVRVSIAGTHFTADGPLLITHWGLSGPAILKLSAFGARHLYEKKYCFKIRINWTGIRNEEEIRQQLSNIRQQNSTRKVINSRLEGLPARLWEHLLVATGISEDQKWEHIGSKSLNQLTNRICNDEYTVNGKTTFREEFVTSGGISLQSVNMNTLESKVCPGLYFAGEVLDIDGLTGGFNLQAAWSTGYVASMLQ